MINNESLKKNGQKISYTKTNFILLFRKFRYYKNSGTSFKEILKLLNIQYRTGKKWSKKMSMIEKIGDVKIDRALNEMIFTSKREIELFNYLKQDLNFWETYEEVTKIIPISRYYFRRVKEYIIEELNSLEQSSCLNGD